MTTKTDENPPGALERRWRSERYRVRYTVGIIHYGTNEFLAYASQFLAAALDSKADPDFTSDHGIVKIPFRFNLEECRRASAVSELPPTIDSSEEIKWWSGLKNSKPSTQYSVTYSITASASSNRGPIASTTQGLHILAVAEAQPPLSPDDFGGEYFLAATVRPTETKRSRRSGRHQIEIAGQEPEPITLDPCNERTQHCTQIPFVIKLLPGQNGLLDPTTFPDRCELTARLVTRTFITPNGTTRAVPTVGGALRDGDSHVRTSRSNEQSFTVAIPRWEEYASGGSTPTTCFHAICHC